MVAVGCLAALWAVGLLLQRYGLSGLAVDRAAIRGWLTGGQLYGQYAFPAGTSLPPIAAVLLVPVAFLPLAAGGLLLALAGVAALLLAVIALAGPVCRRYGRRLPAAVLIAAVLALLAEPVRATLGLGHLDLILFGLITADVVALRRSAWARRRAAWWPGPPASREMRSRFPADHLRRGWSTGTWAGAGIGIATALAAGPALFIAYLAVTRQWRAALTAIGTATTLTLTGLLIAPRATATWFVSVLPGVDRGGPLDAPGNQSLAGVLARLYTSTSTPVLVWLSFAVLLLAVGLIRARSAHADGDEIAAFTLVGLTGAAVAPASTGSRMIWVLPAVLILVDAAVRSRLAARRPRPRRLTGAGYAVAALATYLIFVAPPAWTVGWNAYAIVVIVLVNALPWRPGPIRTTPPLRRPVPAPARVPVGVPARVPAIPAPRGS